MKLVGSLANQRAFKKLWRLSGQPELSIIPPLSTWALPSGVAYDARRGQLINSGQQVAPPWKDQAALVVGFLPQPQQNEVTLNMPGVTTVPKTTVTIQWTAEVAAAIKSAWGVAVNERLYRVTRWTLEPWGVSIPNSIAVELTAAN